MYHCAALCVELYRRATRIAHLRVAVSTTTIASTIRINRELGVARAAAATVAAATARGLLPADQKSPKVL